jgi:hypothetical protein
LRENLYNLDFLLPLLSAQFVKGCQVSFLSRSEAVQPQGESERKRERANISVAQKLSAVERE